MRGSGLALGLAAALWAGSAAAKDGEPCGADMICASNPESVLGAVRKADSTARLTIDAEGDPAIESSASGYRYQILFYGCEAHRNCDSLQFHVAFVRAPENTAELANKWNSTERFLQVAAMPDGRLTASYDVATAGGLNPRNFADVLEWWSSVLGELTFFFSQNIAQPQKDAPPPHTS